MLANRSSGRLRQITAASTVVLGWLWLHIIANKAIIYMVGHMLALGSLLLLSNPLLVHLQICDGPITLTLPNCMLVVVLEYHVMHHRTHLEDVVHLGHHLGYALSILGHLYLGAWVLL